MDAGASGNGMVIARGRPEDRPVVILVGAFQHGSGDPVAARLTAHVTVVRHDRRARGGSGGRAPSPAGREAGELKALIDGAASVVLVFGAWPGAVLAVDGPLIRRLALGEPALATDGGRPPPPAGSVAGVAGLAPADGHGSALEYWVTRAAGPPAEDASNVFRREGDYWTVCYEGSVVRLKDSKGLRHLARLLAHPGRELHATDLEAAESQATRAVPGGTRAAGAELGVRPDLGDAGELLDATAKASYKARLDDLRAELEEAERFNDPVRAANARQERDFLVGELARAVGLGGRDRRAASHAERARLNVTRPSAPRWPTSPAPTPPWARTWRPWSAPAGTAPTPPTPAPRSPGNSDRRGSPAPVNNGAPRLNAPRWRLTPAGGRRGGRQPGQVHSNTSFIARGRSSNGRSEREANAKDEAQFAALQVPFRTR